MTIDFDEFVSLAGIELELRAVHQWRQVSDLAFALQLNLRFESLDEHHQATGLFIISETNSDSARAAIRRGFHSARIPLQVAGRNAWDRQAELGWMEPRR